MGNKYSITEEIAALVAAVSVQKGIIQAIFKARDFAAMPAAQQRLAQVQEELRLLRHRAGALPGERAGKPVLHSATEGTSPGIE